VAETIVDLLRKNYDDQHGVVNVRPVVDKLLERSKDPFSEAWAAFDVDPQWHLPILEAMRVLASTGYCTVEGARYLINATEIVAAEFGSDEYFKSVNALVASPKAAPALTSFISSLLNVETNEFRRRLAFYIFGILLERRTAILPDEIRDSLISAAKGEKSASLKKQFTELLARFPMEANETS
jgi:hypothetical protein